MARKITQRELEVLVLQEVKAKQSKLQKYGVGVGFTLAGATLIAAGIGTVATGGLLAPLAGIAAGLGFFGAAGSFLAVTVDRHMKNSLIKQMKINGEQIDEEGLVNMIDATIQASISDCEDQGQEVDERKLAKFVLKYLDTCFENLPNRVKGNVQFEEVKIKSAGGSATAKQLAKRLAIRALSEKDMLVRDTEAEEFNRAGESTFDAVTSPTSNFMDRVKGWFSGDDESDSDQQALAASHYRDGVVMSEAALRRVIRKSIIDSHSRW